MNEDMQQKISDVQARHADTLMQKANVVGIGIGFRHKGGRRTDEMALIVMVNKKVHESQLAPDDRVPSEIDGVPVDVQETGTFTAQ